MSAPHVEVREATRVYGDGTPDAVTALSGCSLRLERASFCVVRGPSGCGKTTLLRLVAALDRPTAGEVLHDGRALSSLSESGLSTLRRGIGLVFQGDAMLARLSSWENVAYPLIPLGLRRRERHAAAHAALARVGVAHLARKAPENLSGGERQRVGVARALVRRPALVVADEPAAHVDDETARDVIDALSEVVERGGTVIAASHRADVVAAASTVVELRR